MREKGQVVAATPPSPRSGAALAVAGVTQGVVKWQQWGPGTPEPRNGVARAGLALQRSVGCEKTRG